MSKVEQHYDENGELHRIDGPALAYPDGVMLWYRHGKYHRRGRPAAVYSGRSKFWYVNGHHLQAPEQLPKATHSIMELFL